MIRSLRNLFGQPAFAVLTAVFGFLVFNWPFLEAARTHGDLALFLYLFTAWTAIILLAFLISRAVPDSDREQSDRNV